MGMRSPAFEYPSKALSHSSQKSANCKPRPSQTNTNSSPWSNSLSTPTSSLCQVRSCVTFTPTGSPAAATSTTQNSSAPAPTSVGHLHRPHAGHGPPASPRASSQTVRAVGKHRKGERRRCRGSMGGGKRRC